MPVAARERAGRRSRAWRALVPVVCLIAGVGFAASARDSAGTDLRPPGTANLADLVRNAEAHVQKAARDLAGLQKQVTATTNLAGQGNSAVAAAQRRAEPLLVPGGLTKVHGPGIVVILDDAPAQPADTSVDPNQLVVHQSDLQAVVNALWAGGAEAMTIAGQRVIATSAVRCVGNTLLLNGDVFSPPFRVAAIGPYPTMLSELNASPGVRLFEQAASYYGLGYTVGSVGRLDLPAYSGSIGLAYARAGTK
ncbi:MAG: DUF881 domain-containing protein [Jatrophihabitantaceae bacterium]